VVLCCNWLSNHDYANWLSDVKSRIAMARSRAALAVNAELIQLYHSIGQDILRKQVEQSWIPNIKGFCKIVAV
jgi:hypothetical protein